MPWDWHTQGMAAGWKGATDGSLFYLYHFRKSWQQTLYLAYYTYLTIASSFGKLLYGSYGWNGFVLVMIKNGKKKKINNGSWDIDGPKPTRGYTGLEMKWVVFICQVCGWWDGPLGKGTCPHFPAGGSECWEEPASSSRVSTELPGCAWVLSLWNGQWKCKPDKFFPS